MKGDRFAVCFIHDGMGGQPLRRAAAQTTVESMPGGTYLCLTCAEALSEHGGVAVRWLERDR